MIIAGNVKFKQIYTCKDCGIAVYGGTQYKTIDVLLIDDFIEEIKNIPLYVNHMPVGWSHDLSGYHCKCKVKDTNG